MSTTLIEQVSPVATASWWKRQSKSRRMMYITLGSFVVISLVRAISGEKDLTSKFTITQTLTAMLPIMLAGLGGLLSERVGIVNVGLEGMMIAGTWGAGFLGYHWGPWGALFGAMVCGMIGGLLHALATVTFGVDHAVSGVALNLLAFGWARFLSGALFKGRGSGSETNSPGFATTRLMGSFQVPGLKDGGPMAKLEGHHWPIISDAAGVVRGLFAEIKLYQVIALIMIPAVWYLVFRTPFGLRLRASGERPSAPDSLGVNVVRTRYIAVILSGALAGLGGAMLVLNNNGGYAENQTNNRGFLGLAALIFGNWRPGGTVAGATLFGFFDSLQLTAVGAVRALFLLAAVAAAAGALISWKRSKKTKTPSALVALAAVMMWLFVSKFKMPDDLVKALPYFVTLVVLAVFSRRLRGPAAAGMPWRKGQLG
jgi:general nucleoside transport system permease protein